jgi:hypothetical protein
VFRCILGTEPTGAHHFQEEFVTLVFLPLSASLSPSFRVLSTLRNRRATSHRSHLALIPIEKLFSGRDDILVYTSKSSADYAQSNDPFSHALDHPAAISLLQHHPAPEAPQWKVPASERPNVLRRVKDNQEPLRTVAEDYGVSYETIRCIVRAARILARKREA